MATIKQGPAPEDHYAMIPNAFARSSTIPARAKTVYLYIRSHRTGWSLSTDRIADALGMSPTTVKAAIRDLEQSGWVTRTQVHGDGGTFGSCEYTVHSMPVDRGTDSVPRTVVQKTAGGLTASGKSDPHKKTIPSKKTKSEEDHPPVVPQRGTGQGMGVALIEDPERPASSGYPPAFEAWWADYPKKTGKGDAFRKWKAAKKGIGADELHTRLLDRLPGLIATQQRDPRYVPNPATWLNQGRYDDPVEEVAQPMSQTQKRQQSIIDAANQLFAQEVSHDRPAIG